jgi:hypothetical protein
MVFLPTVAGAGQLKVVTFPLGEVSDTIIVVASTGNPILGHPQQSREDLRSYNE